MWSLLLLLACPSRTAPAAATPGDDALRAPFRVAVVGEGPASRGLVDDVIGQGVDWVVNARGDLAFEGVPQLVLPGASPSAAGVSWGAVEVPTDAGVWRLVWLDGAEPLEQGFWLPGTGRGALAGALVFEASASPSLWDSARDALPADALALRIDGAQRINAFRLPEAAWGPGELVAGASGGAAESLPQEGLDEGFRDALIASMARDLPASRGPLEAGAAFDPPALAVSGWWQLDIAADGGLTVTFRRREADGQWHAVPASRWTRRGGWGS